MPLAPLEFAPGIDADSPNYAGRGKWTDCNLIRFRDKFPESVGGWTKINTTALAGYVREIVQFSILDGSVLLAVGTSNRFYIIDGGTPDENTPLRAISGSLTNPIDTSNTSSTITVTHTSHGASIGDWVVISGSAAVGGITAAQINSTFQIVTVPTANTFTVLTTGTATSTANGGGAAVVVEYLIVVGAAGQSAGTGWGAGTWGHDTWNSDATPTGTSAYLALWSINQYNAEDLIINPRGGSVYYWDATTPTTRPALLSTLGGAANTPTSAIKTLVSAFDGHVIVFGCNPAGSSTLDPMLVRWSDQESAALWTASDVTSAGSKKLSKGSKIITAVQVADNILIFTDTAVYAMKWIGGPLVFSFELIADGMDLAGPNAIVSSRDNVYWMGKGGFYRFNGTTVDPNPSLEIEEIACSIQDYVFLDVDWSQSEKTYAGTNYTFNEIIWFYSSTDSTNTEPDKYVVYNTAQNIWYYGTLDRTCWVDSYYQTNPIAADTDGYLYYQEYGSNDGSTSPATALSPYIESGPFDIDDGNRFQFITKIIHDVSFRGDDPIGQTLTLTLSAADYPGQLYHDTTTGSAIRTSVTTIQQYTNQSYVRIRGRQFKIKASSNAVGTSWRLGFPRIEVRPDGQK